MLRYSARYNGRTMENVLSLLTGLFIGAIGAYFSGYSKKKGENLATKEDIQDLTAQTALLTQTAKEIEAKISNEMWDRQKHWELKKDAVLAVMSALGKADDALHLYSTAIEAERKAKNPSEFGLAKMAAESVWYRTQEDFEMKRAMSVIVCEKEMNDTLMDIMQQLRSGVLRMVKGDAVYSDLSPALKPALQKSFACARSELGIAPIKR